MLRVGVFSESAFTFDGHGVHTAFRECQALLSQIPEVQLVNPWELRPSDILHVHSAGPGALAMLLSHTGPKVITAHLTEDSFLGSIEYAQYFKSTIAAYLRFFYSHADLILAVSASAGSYLHQQLKVNKPVEVSPNTIDDGAIVELRGKRAQVRAQLHCSSPRRPVVLGVGQIQPRKGIDDFVAVARAMPTADFVWVGGFLFGPLSADKRRLQRAVQDAPSNLLFTGKVPREFVYKQYVAADVFLFPSHQETFGLAILEASMAGLPLVLRDLPGYRSIFRDSYIAVSDNDYASAVFALLGDRELLHSYSKKALAAAEDYTSKRHARELVSLYKLAKLLSYR
jgi:1,2-diacylglycerol-3-alpha-glucose alpha-1,2-galactosyltransferase